MSTPYQFPSPYEKRPTIYAYTDESYPGLIKIGYTTRDVATRVAEQYPTIPKEAKKPYKIRLIETATRPDGTSFTDRDVHKYLVAGGFQRDKEWFACTVRDAKEAIVAVRERSLNIERRVDDFKMRPEQREAVEKTAEYFESIFAENRVPRFLWNAKMRFGKTFATYQLAKKLGYKRVLILTFKPAVRSAWRDDLISHIDFQGWQFIANPQRYDLFDNIDVQFRNADKSRPIVCFGSFQDFLGQVNGCIKPKNEWVHTVHWDLVVFDEYHFGAWRDNAKKLFDDVDEMKQAEKEDKLYDLPTSKSSKKNQDELVEERGDARDETWLPITARSYLYLSGTPFRALNSGEFIEEQIYNWTYSDEQRAKENWQGSGENPYASLPRLALLTYRLPEAIRKIAENGEFNEFDLNEFFSAEGEKDEARFKYEDYVQKWLDLIRGAYLENESDNLKLGRGKAPMPFSDARLLHLCPHTLWFLPSVAACYAMRNLLSRNQNVFYHDYIVNVCAGAEAGIGVEALAPVEKSMDDPLNSKTITLSCGKLTTGVTVKPWSGILMLRKLSTPETYFQTAFRAQSPWVVEGEDGKKEIVKRECYVFDFALERALKQIADYGLQLSVDNQSPEKKVEEIIGFLPVLAYDGASMQQISAADILDIATSGTSATMLARRWESSLLVNVDNTTLSRLLENEQAIAALQNIEGFRALNQDIETIINKTESVKKAKKKSEEETKKEKKEISDEEKEIKSKRKEIQEKLVKLATRIPIFMYLSDYREETLMDVILALEPRLFEKVTGLRVDDFNLLCSLNVFNSELMNDAVYKFKRYEDSSLSYSGYNPHGSDARVGLYDRAISVEQFRDLYENQQKSMIG